MDSDRIATQSRQDQQWMEFDTWYAEQDAGPMLAMIEIIDCQPEDGPYAMRSLDDYELELLRRLTLHALRELALRNTRPQEQD